MARYRLVLNLFIAVIVLTGCATAPPRHQQDLCAVFTQHPDWYDYAREAQKTWGTPAQILMAFVKAESSYRENAKPPFHWFLFIPLGRDSSAKGYAQIQDPAWEDYRKARGGWFRSRSDMEDVLDFIGWYNHKSHKLLGISRWDAKHLYLAYHEGFTGYRQGGWKHKPGVLAAARRVARTAREYGAQLRRCDHRFRCRKWWQIGPFCS